jgi:ribonucleoside-diphosphate reductase alpha chain
MDKSGAGVKFLEPISAIKTEPKTEPKIEIKTDIDIKPKQEIKIEVKQEPKPDTADILEEVANFIFVNKYARYNEKHKRRETWEEAVDRLYKMHIRKYHFLSSEDLNEIKQCFDMVRQKRVVPAMRSMQFGGKAIEGKNEKLYNCSMRHIDSIRSFAEVMFLLLNGCGVGIGLSKYFLSRLPNLVDADDKTGTVITYVIEDTIEGWADSIEALLNCYFKNTAYTGRRIVFDYSKIRKKGAPLKTSGGKAPGYKGLKTTHEKIKALLDHVIEDLEQGRLKSINAYDIVMHCSDAVLSGGVRRSATCVIFEKDDLDMMNAKTYFKVDKKKRFSFDKETNKHHGSVQIGKKVYEVELDEYNWNILEKENKISWLWVEPQRARSNNSVLLLRDTTTKEELLEIIKKTKEFGEPGFVFANHPWQLFNPCAEIAAIPVTEGGVCGTQFCNLTSINGRKIKTKEDFRACVKAATILGTLQSGYTHFPYLSNAAKELTESEALLGVSITGMMDSPEILLNPDIQKEMATFAVEANKVWAKKIGVKQAARVTCLKPEGTSSLALGCASGIHPHHAKKYFRRVQCNKLDNVYKFFKKHNPHLCEESCWSTNKTDDVITFPLEIKHDCMVKKDLDAIKHLEIVKSTQKNWVNTGTTEANKKPITHNVSCTIIVQNDEWDKVTDYLYENKQYFSGISFLHSCGDKSYKQAPMEAVITPEDEIRFNEMVQKYKHVDYTKLTEEDDETQLQQEFSCAGGACEIR